MTDDLTLKQKEQILLAYTEYLKAQIALGIKPTDDEVQLLMDGAELFMGDLKGTFREVIAALNEIFEHQRSVMAQMIPELVENGGDEE